MQKDDANGVMVEVAYARPDVQRIVKVLVPFDASAREAVRRSGLSGAFPEIDPETCPLGVFGRAVDESYRLKRGDRVEIYRPLLMDPKEARRQRAARRIRKA